MFKEYKYEVPGGFVRFEIKNDEVYLTGFGGRPFEVKIPSELEEHPVTRVTKKAFQGAKSLKNVSLPGSIREIEDWAFSACSILENFELRDMEDTEALVLGQGIFAKSKALKKIIIGCDEAKYSLLAAAVSMMDAEYLLGNLSHFYEQWDAKLRAIYSENDEDGFVFMVLCGEEDLTADVVQYREERRQRKAELSMLRLQNDTLLSDDFRLFMTDYLKTHTCGCTSDAAFKVILKHSEEEGYQKIFFDLGLLNDDNFELVLSELGDRYAALKAKVLSGHKTENDFFDDLEL